MKKILLTALSVLLAATASLAATFSNNYSLSGFTGIRASSVFHVDVSQSSRYSVSVEAPDYLEPYISVEVEQNQLVLRMKQMPRAIEKRLSSENSGAVVAVVRMPRLESVSMSGAAVLRADGDFPTLKERPFRLDMSGASKARGLSLSASAAVISLSGAVEAGLTGRFGEMRIEASGAASAKLGIEAPVVKAELSGSGHLNMEGMFEDVSIQASGASGVHLLSEKVLSSLRIQGSGASSIDCRSAKAQNVRVGLSGASNCKVAALRTFEVEASGASSCSYEDAPGLDTDIIQVSRGASLRKL
ncbi:MAG: DUF2807 domain-containing protein [Bacteroidales bacterium]|nr:DUF2807 domain-containing protein [Bacteroidales bacterium]